MLSFLSWLVKCVVTITNDYFSMYDFLYSIRMQIAFKCYSKHFSPFVWSKYKSGSLRSRPGGVDFCPGEDVPMGKRGFISLQRCHRFWIWITWPGNNVPRLPGSVVPSKTVTLLWPLSNQFALSWHHIPSLSLELGYPGNIGISRTEQLFC